MVSSSPMTALVKVTSWAWAFFFPLPFWHCSNQTYFCFLPGWLDLVGPCFFWYGFPEDWWAELKFCCSNSLWWELFWFLHWLLVGGPCWIMLVLFTEAEGSSNSTLVIWEDNGLHKEWKSISHKTQLVMVSIVEFVSSTVYVIVENKVKNLSSISVRIIIAWNDCGRFKPACIIYSKSCMTVLISSLAEWG